LRFSAVPGSKARKILLSWIVCVKVIFVITTDGYENASRKFSYDKVKSMITHQTEKYGWEFIFMGANIDVDKEGEKLGISEDRACSFSASSSGMGPMYDKVATLCCALR